MKFICSGDHFYKVFIESILDMEPTYLIQNYLHQVECIYFDKEILKNPFSEITIQSNDITALKDIVSEKELNKIMMHRFVDELKEMIASRLDTDDIDGYYKLCIRVGEYREHLLSLVQNLHLNTKKISPKLESMENALGGDFKKYRNEAALSICRKLHKENDYRHDDENKLISSDIDDITHTSDKGVSLEFLTHNRNTNSQYKSQKNDWETYKEEFENYFREFRTDNGPAEHIKNIHDLLIRSKIEGASSFKDIQNIITIKTSAPAFREDGPHGYLKSNLWKVDENDNYSKLLNDYGHKPNSYQPSDKYIEKLESRARTIRNTLPKNLDSIPNKAFNINETLRLLLHIEMHVLLKLGIRKGNLEEENQHLITNYITMIDEMQEHLVHFNTGIHSELYLSMKKIVFDDLFGRVKIDASNIFTTTIREMEEVLSTVLNNSNYNFSSLNIIKLLEKFIAAFDEFLEENERFNRSVKDASRNTSSGLPDLNTLKTHFNAVEKYNKIYREFTKNHNINFHEEHLVFKAFKNTNIYEEKQK